MSADQWTYQTLQATNSISSPSPDYVSGSDEAELERVARAYGGAVANGEVLVSYEDDFRDLGILND
jgi:hypothetical protein